MPMCTTGTQGPVMGVSLSSTSSSLSSSSSSTTTTITAENEERPVLSSGSFLPPLIDDMLSGENSVANEEHQDDQELDSFPNPARKKTLPQLKLLEIAKYNQMQQKIFDLKMKKLEVRKEELAQQLLDQEREVANKKLELMMKIANKKLELKSAKVNKQIEISYERLAILKK